MKRKDLSMLLAAILLCCSCGKSEEHLRCEKAFKTYFGENMAAAALAACFGAGDANALNITSIDMAEYKVISELRVSDSLNILRQKAEEKYQWKLKMDTDWMNACKKNFDKKVNAYYKERKEAKEALERYRQGKSYMWSSEVYGYEKILSKPEKTIEELQEDALKDPTGFYSRYVNTKKNVDDMIARKDEIIDNWFQEIGHYKTMAPNKVLAKYVKVTYYKNGNKNNKYDMYLVFKTDLSKVIGEMN